jgi:hypothetical protein
VEFIRVQIPSPTGYVVPIGDVHFGSRSFGKVGRAKLAGYLHWLEDHQQNARAFGLGDLFDVATRVSKTSPFESRPEEVEEAIDYFTPYRKLFVGWVDGNHEARAIDMLGWSPAKIFCKVLEIPYCGWSAVMRLQVGKRDETRFQNTYNVYIHHTTGGGDIASALRRIMKLEGIVEGCDVYLGGHNHQLVTGVKSVFRPTSVGVEDRKVHYVSCGSYLDYKGSYAERFMYAPSKLGSPRIRFSGERDHPDVHVSL